MVLVVVLVVTEGGWIAAHEADGKDDEDEDADSDGLDLIETGPIFSLLKVRPARIASLTIQVNGIWLVGYSSSSSGRQPPPTSL